MSSLSGRRVTDLTGGIPHAGSYVFFCHLDSGDPPDPGPAVLTIGDLPIVGRVLPNLGGVESPSRPAVVFAGGDGWNTPLPAPGGAYASPGGVRLSVVLRDLATAAGEPYDAPPEVNLGTAYEWDASDPTRVVRCADVLADLVARKAIPLWRVEPTTGRTVFTPWPSRGPADAHGRIIDRALAVGAREVALDSAVAAWLPGATVQGAAIASVDFEEKPGELRITTWSPPTRATTPWRSMFDRQYPWIARIGTAPSGALAIRSAAGRIEMEGGALPAARATDFVVRFAFDPLVPALYYSVVASDDVSDNHAWAPVATTVGPPPGGFLGTKIVIVGGSNKVKIG